MPRYPQAEWSKKSRWWAEPGGPTEIDRRKLVRSWIDRAEPPKPDVKEFGDELRGWSGVLGGIGWVRAEAEYGATACLLAQSNTLIDEPDGWDKVSRLYREYGDGLARFSAGFAEVAHDWRPVGLPDKLTDSVRSYKRRVPPRVRAAMHSPVRDDLGGVVDTAAAAEAFLADPELHRDRYVPVARCAYAAVLDEKAKRLSDDPESWMLFIERADELCPGGAERRREPMDADREHTTDDWDKADHRKRAAQLLAEQVRKDWARLSRDPHLGEAVARALPLLARWLAEGREVTDATIFYTKLRHARLDAAQRERRLEKREEPTDPIELPERSADDPALRRPVLRDIIERARAALLEFPAPAPDGAGDCWEKRYALDLLADPVAYGLGTTGLRARVVAAWSSAGPPPDSARRSSRTAAEFVIALLRVALEAVTDPEDAREILGLPPADWTARIEAARRLLERHRPNDPDGGVAA